MWESHRLPIQKCDKNEDGSARKRSRSKETYNLSYLSMYLQCRSSKEIDFFVAATSGLQNMILIARSRIALPRSMVLVYGGDPYGALLICSEAHQAFLEGQLI